jgi:hypothetical protein
MEKEKTENLQEEVKKAGFTSIDNFLKANLHYLPENKQRLFYLLQDLDDDFYQAKKIIKSNYQRAEYNGKG